MQQIMSDPVMQSILQQAQNEPESMMQHMQNPGIRAKIEKLVKAVSNTGSPILNFAEQHGGASSPSRSSTVALAGGRLPSENVTDPLHTSPLHYHRVSSRLAVLECNRSSSSDDTVSLSRLGLVSPLVVLSPS